MSQSGKGSRESTGYTLNTNHHRSLDHLLLPGCFATLNKFSLSYFSLTAQILAQGSLSLLSPLSYLDSVHDNPQDCPATVHLIQLKFTPKRLKYTIHYFLDLQKGKTGNRDTIHWHVNTVLNIRHFSRGRNNKSKHKNVVFQIIHFPNQKSSQDQATLIQNHSTCTKLIPPKLRQAAQSQGRLELLTLVFKSKPQI